MTITTYLANRPVTTKDSTSPEDYRKIFTAREGQFYQGFTEMRISELQKGVEGSDLLLDKNLKALLPFKKQLMEGRTIDVQVEWELTEDRRDYKWVSVLGVVIREVEPE